jgi:hypothetical protein
MRKIFLNFNFRVENRCYSRRDVRFVKELHILLFLPTKSLERRKKMLESKFQALLIKELTILFPGCVILKNDPTYIQGFPDLLILYGNTWAALECKSSRTDIFQPNQEYYLDILKNMAYANVIYPENKEAVINELQQAFGFSWAPRISGR